MASFAGSDAEALVYYCDGERVSASTPIADLPEIFRGVIHLTAVSPQQQFVLRVGELVHRLYLQPAEEVFWKAAERQCLDKTGFCRRESARFA